MGKFNLPRIKKIISGFKGQKLLVVGDLMLDRFIWGKVSRISPEAPIPVVEVESVSSMPGGSANVVNNVCSLGGKGYAAGVIGNDADGKHLLDLLREKGSDTSCVIRSKSIRTIVKTRVIAHHQHVVRIDNEHYLENNSAVLARLAGAVVSGISDVDGVIFEDYGKGVITQDIVSRIINECKKHRMIIVADPKTGHNIDYSGVTAVTPNASEACYFAGIEDRHPDPLNEAGKRLLEKWRGASILMTLGDKGICLFEQGEKPQMITTTPKDVFDVAGAGDTVVASFAMSLLSGADMYEAATIANIAAGIVVQKSGVATVSCEEILNVFKGEHNI